MSEGLWMTLLVVGIVVVVPTVFGVVSWALRRPGERADTFRRQGGGFMGAAFDEVFHPDAKAARQILEQQSELPAPTPAPGDPPFDPEAGRITIMLPREPEPDR